MRVRWRRRRELDGVGGGESDGYRTELEAASERGKRGGGESEGDGGLQRVRDRAGGGGNAPKRREGRKGY